MPRTREHPQVEVRPRVVEAPYGIEVVGRGWRSCPVRLTVGGAGATRLRVLLGEPQGELVRPLGGEFVAVVDVRGLEAGEHIVQAVSTGHAVKESAEATLVLLDIPELEKDGRPTMRWLRRRLDFNARRFPDGVPRPGARVRALAHRDAMRIQRGDDPQLVPHFPLHGRRPSPPVHPGCNWYPIGPSVVRNGQVFGVFPVGGAPVYTTAPISGRVTDFAIDPHDPRTIYAATAQGGIWKSLNGGLDWEPKTDFAPSLACGCVTVDPSAVDASGRSTRILVGTGEPNNSDSYYGVGMLISTDGGDTWAARGTTTFVRAAFSTISVDPANNQHLLASTDQGVYESTDEGVNWTQVDAGISNDLVVDWSNAGGAEVYVGRIGGTIRRRVGTAGWTTLGGGLPAGSMGTRAALAMAPSDANTIYAAIPSPPPLSTVNFYKTTDGGTTWTATAGTVSGSQLAGSHDRRRTHQQPPHRGLPWAPDGHRATPATPASHSQTRSTPGPGGFALRRAGLRALSSFFGKRTHPPPPGEPADGHERSAAAVRVLCLPRAAERIGG